ncbi:MAG: hypothetical protein KF889_15125 [Alphaproteobacteria bacterium]|nr:hypothetical protein [Alphaproteobacteria bacterium]MCW5740293.1 hypothetical protein [Alphaproteobacteria bacterium]
MPARRKSVDVQDPSEVVRVTAQLTGAQLVALDFVAKRDGTNLSSVLRRAVNELMSKEAAKDPDLKAALLRAEVAIAYREWLVTQQAPVGVSGDVLAAFWKRVKAESRTTRKTGREKAAA